MFQRPSEEKRVELLAVTGRGDSPAEPAEHQRPVITPGAALPAAVGRQHSRHVVVGEQQLPGQAPDRGRWAIAQLIRNPARPRQRAELNRSTDPVLNPDIRAQPAEVVVVSGK